MGYFVRFPQVSGHDASQMHYFLTAKRIPQSFSAINVPSTPAPYLAPTESKCPNCDSTVLNYDARHHATAFHFGTIFKGMYAFVSYHIYLF